jgi:hypothetical protein
LLTARLLLSLAPGQLRAYYFPQVELVFPVEQQLAGNFLSTPSFVLFVPFVNLFGPCKRRLHPGFDLALLKMFQALKMVEAVAAGSWDAVALGTALDAGGQLPI